MLGFDFGTLAFAVGSFRRKTADSPGFESQVSVPPQPSTIERLMGSPSPNPLDLVE